METKYSGPLADNQSKADFFYFKASGFSMWPFLSDGERVIVKKAPISRLRRGDIVLYTQGEKIVCHRLIKMVKGISGIILFTRGDNSFSHPEPIEENMYIGKAVAIERKGRLTDLDSFFFRGLNPLIIIIGPFFGMAARMLKRILKSRTGEIIFLSKREL